ncbi:MAG TPA: hypothetical protein VHQ90_04445 [Thermoanaerobaculia bacterium]|nr:hypothetical protein [Thermoanaerobaculia bacterium]
MIPRFRVEQLNRRLASGTVGDAFQQFVFELLRRAHPDLQVYPAGGKDGGIDLVEPLAGGGRSVFECKHIGADGLEDAQARWRAVKRNLTRNLADPAGPPSGQGQYSPWYAADFPIRSYTFCISSVLQNDSQRQDLQTEIQDFFSHLASGGPHLAHLAGLRVEILSWQDLSARLADHPHLLFKWFPEARPRGLALLGEGGDWVGFRAYLTHEHLPYYAREQHLERHPAPDGGRIAGEETLLAAVQAPAKTGLVVTGGGGFGKTRLMLELGRRAQVKGWVVFRAQGRLRSDSIEHLADQLTPQTPALLLIDYIETQPDYTELVETLTLLADERQLPLRYVACCRSSFYPSIRLIGRHHHLDLSPEGSDPASDAWLESYRQRAVEHILEHTGVPRAQQVAAVCRCIPVLAVFATWLHHLGRQADLRELIQERDFGTWVLKRIQQSFPGRQVSGSLAALMALLPLADPATDLLNPEQRDLLNTLSRDAWVERVILADDPAGRWEAAHDVLADQVLLAHLEMIAAITRTFVRDLLAEGARVGAVSSVLLALQRVALTPALAGLPWLDLLAEAMTEWPDAWREARFLVLRFPLFTATDRIRLLDRAAPAWHGAEVEIEFQNSIGWLAGYESKYRDLGPEELAGLIEWLRGLAPLVSRSNFLLTKGLLLDAQSVRGAALCWLRDRPKLFQTHYLLRSWLAVGLPTEDVGDVVRHWLVRFESSFHASFVLAAWLDAGGEKDLVGDHLRRWLTHHEPVPEAQFVFRAWLDAGGEKDLVGDHLRCWLTHHELLPEASFVFKGWLDAGGEKDLVGNHLGRWLTHHELLPEAGFAFKGWLDAGGDKDLVGNHLRHWLAKNEMLPEVDFLIKAWLEAGGDFELIREAAIRWLHVHHDEPGAVFAIKHLARQRELPSETVSHILSWCGRFADNEDAPWRLVSLEPYLLRPQLYAEVVAASEAVVGTTLAQPQPQPTRCALISLLFSIIGESAVLRASTLPLFLRWLRHPASYLGLHLKRDGTPSHLQRSAERDSLVLYLDDLIRAGALNVDREKTALRYFFHWIGGWAPENRERAREILRRLAERGGGVPRWPPPTEDLPEKGSEPGALDPGGGVSMHDEQAL